MNKSSEILLPLLVGIVVLGGLGYLAVKVSDIDGSVRSVDTKIGNAEKRLDRIADALPLIQTRIAMEEVQKPIRTALIMTTPIQDAKGQWKVNVHVLDSAKSERTTYAVSLANQSDRRPIYQLVGASAEAEPTAPTVRDLASWSSEIKNPKSLPSFVDVKGSIVFRHTSAGDVIKLYQLGAEVERRKLTSTIYDWNQLAEALKSNPAQFEPIP